MAKAEILIVDTNAFIQHANLQEIGKNVITCPEVLHEVKHKRQLKRLAVVPYDIQVEDPFPENIKFVTEFSKKTGDYPSLSAVDIKLIALTYQFEKQKVGVDHLAKEPKITKEVAFTKKSVINSSDIPGFYFPKSNQNDKTKNQEDVDSKNDSNSENINDTEDLGNCEDDKKSENDDSSEYEECDEGYEDNDDNDNENNEEEYDEEEDDEDDDEGWITPENIDEMKKKMGGEMIEAKPIVVGCLTMDFAMQNVMKQIGLNVVTINGYVIKQLRTFIFRCYACFKTTSVMTHIFCPNCGNKTLKKVAVSLDENGKQVIHINYRKRITGKGKKHSIPTPKGGKHVVRPITVADQPMPKQHASKLAKMKNNPLDPDYIAGYSPFVMRDVNSKAAMLGIYTNRYINDPKYLKQVARSTNPSSKKTSRRRK